MESINLKKLFYQKMGKTKEDRINRTICFDSHFGQDCLALTKEAGSNVIALRLNDSQIVLDLNNLNQENFQYWFGAKNDKNQVTHLLDLRQLFFVDAAQIKKQGVNAESDGSPIFLDSFSKNPAHLSDKDVWKVFKEDYDSKKIKMQISSVYEDNYEGRNSKYQRVLGESPLAVEF
jgi:hypothetical protein